MKKCLSILFATTALILNSSQAAIVYDNSTTFENQFNNSTLESGDEIVLAGTERFVTQFSFEYFADFAATGDERARVRLYQMNGTPGENPFATPGTLLYDSGAFNIESGYRTVTIGDMGLFLTESRIAWTVEFTGLAETEEAGLLYYDPPSVGSSDDYFWQKENGAWLAVATDRTGNNFAAQLSATAGFRISDVRNVTGGAAVTVDGATAGRTYTLEYKISVTEVGWHRGASAVATGTALALTDTFAQEATFRLYRVEERN